MLSSQILYRIVFSPVRPPQVESSQVSPFICLAWDLKLSTPGIAKSLSLAAQEAEESLEKFLRRLSLA